MLGSRLGNRKRFIVATGFAERLFRCSPIAIPLLGARHFHLDALLLLAGAGRNRPDSHIGDLQRFPLFESL